MTNHQLLPKLLLLALATSCCSSFFVDAFVHVRPTTNIRSQQPFSTTLSSSALSALMDPGTGLVIGPEEVGAARGAFLLCFFGAAGSATLGRQALPVVWSKFRLTQDLKGLGPTLGGNKLGLSSLLTLYPDDVAVRDVQAVLNSNQTVADMIAEFPLPPSKTPGYLHYETFAKAHPDVNPLAVRAVFESLAVTSDIVTPKQAQFAMDTYRNDLELLKENLTKSKVTSYTACLLLIVILGAADYFAIYHLYKGWFPEWPGAVDFPFLLFDQDFGLTAIPKYWLGDNWNVDNL